MQKNFMSPQLCLPAENVLKRAEISFVSFLSNIIHVHLLAELNLHSESYLQGSLENGPLFWKMRTGTENH